MIVTRFKGDSKFDFFKCFAFHRRYKDLQLISHDSKPSQRGITKIKNELSNDVQLLTASFGEKISLETIGKIEEIYFVKVTIWVKKNQRDCLRVGWESSADHYDKQFTDHLNIYSTSFDQFANPDLTKLALILDIQKFTDQHQYNPENNTQASRKMTLFQAVVSELQPTLVGDQFLKKVKCFEEKWGKAEFDFTNDIKRFYKLFGLGMQLWTSQSIGNRKVRKKVHDTFWKKKVVFVLDDFDEHEVIFTHWTLSYIFDVTCIKYYSCSKKNCFFGSSDYFKYQSHILRCRDETLITYKQVKYSKPDDHLRRELVEEKVLPNSSYHNTSFVVYDVESLMRKPDDLGITGLQSIHRLATIAIVSNFGEDREHFLYRREMSPDGLEFLVEEFVDRLLSLRLEMLKHLPRSITDGLKRYYAEMQSPEFKKFSPMKKANIQAKAKLLKDIVCLRIYAWNGERELGSKTFLHIYLIFYYIMHVFEPSTDMI